MVGTVRWVHGVVPRVHRYKVKIQYVLSELGFHCCSIDNWSPGDTFPVQVAELGGWLVEFQNIAAVDKELDSKPEKNHTFLQQRSVLVERKKTNPKCRINTEMMSAPQGNDQCIRRENHRHERPQSSLDGIEEV